MVIASMSQNIYLPHSVVKLEALATGRALEFSLDKGIRSAILEGDLEIVINALKVDFSSLASFGL